MPFNRKNAEPFDASGDRPPSPLTPDEALVRLENFCAYRERCPREVRRKMTELNLEGETAEQVWQVLVGDGYVDEERFALAFAGGKFRTNHWGRVRIRLELQQRAIPPHLIQRGLEAIDEAEYLAVLQELLTKKYKQYRSDPNARAKVATSLIRAGFEPELVFQQLPALYNGQETRF